ncbi:MAG: hypothetical protein ABIB71_08185 [Candidatus Woesearchaeota archaeon]
MKPMKVYPEGSKGKKKLLELFDKEGSVLGDDREMKTGRYYIVVDYDLSPFLQAYNKMKGAQG